MLKTLFKVERSDQKSLQGGFVCLFSESSAEYFKRDRQKQLHPIIFFPLGYFQSAMGPGIRKIGYSCFTKLNANEELCFLHVLFIDFPVQYLLEVRKL